LKALNAAINGRALAVDIKMSIIDVQINSRCDVTILDSAHS